MKYLWSGLPFKLLFCIMSESSTCFQFTVCQKMKALGILVTGGFLFLIQQSLEVSFGMLPTVLNKDDFGLWGGVA